MFNDYVWKTYLKAGGNKVVELFKKNLSGTFSKEYIDKLVELRSFYCPSEAILSDFREQMSDVENNLKNSNGLLENGEYSIESALTYLFNFLRDDSNTSVSTVFRDFCGSIDFYTTFLSVELPELFFPYYFQYNFNVLEMISNEFGIDIPPIPVKKDHVGRFLYYGDICDSFFKFRESHNLTNYEFLAFLYDFAPKYIGGIRSYIVSDLPEPQSAFFIGGNSDDRFLVDNTDEIALWQCSQNAKAGDIAVMYLRSPVSAVSSVWNCVSDGFVDPFFYYYKCAYISNPKTINSISQKQLQKDRIFKDFSLVKKNMQGINGVELLPSQYNHLIDMASANVKRLEYTVTKAGTELMCERDVEEKLIVPLIMNLGYSDCDYEKQLHIEIGNHNSMIIPDFVILPTKDKGQQSAFAIIEAKYHIQSKKEFENAKIQVRSYARQCIAKYSIIADCDSFYVSSSNDDFTESIFISTWDKLNDNDIFSSLKKILGKSI